MSFIEAKEVYYRYPQAEKDALCGVDLTVEKGEYVAVIGHNGSGKSTLARLLNGLLQPTKGEIFVDGISAADKKTLFELRKRVGVVFQNPDNQLVASIVEDDVAFGPENIGVPRKEIGERIDFALSAVETDKRNIRETAQLDHIRSEETVGLVRPGGFHRCKIGLFCADIAGDLKPVSRESEDVFQIFRRIFQSEENIQKECVMPFFYESPAYSCCGRQGDVPLCA